jgi:hypothetical protein
MTAGLIPLAELQQDCLNYVTFYYETGKVAPDCYGVMSGNFDGAGGSYGIIQFNWKSGTIQPLFLDLINNHIDVIAKCFTATSDYNTFIDVVKNRSTADQIAWGDTITDPANKHKVLEPWNTYFVNLGKEPANQSKQKALCQNYFNSANVWKGDYSLWSRRGYALLFDIAVQSGSISTAVHDLIMSDFATIDYNQSRQTIEVQKMQYIANRRADAVSSSYQSSYRDRKLAIANGSGTVYGGFVDTTPYDLILEPAYDTDVVTVSTTPSGQTTVTPTGHQMITIHHNIVGV